jgi:hypothetical protein
VEKNLRLDQPRAIAIVDRGKTFIYRFRRILAEDWKRFFSGIVNQSEDDGKGGRIQTLDVQTPLLTLVEDALVNVEGFRTPDGTALEQVKDWKQRLPVGQRLAVGRMLKDVNPVEATEDTPFLSETIDVSLRCSWSEESGKMTAYSGLIHRFNSPSLDQLKRYNRENARSIVVGGSRTGKTVYPGTQSLLMKLYDELIAGVEGYAILDDAPLRDNVAAVREQMDAYHKVAAVATLFTSAGAEAPVEDAE